jgi:hypothetical protein
MIDFNTTYMSQLIGQSNVTVVYLWADGDYWIRQQEFCDAFRAAPVSHNVVIHVQYEGLSLTQSRVVPTVEKIIQETGRSAESVFVFSPNAIADDAPWTNLFWREFKVSDEFIRSRTYQTHGSRDLDSDWRPWALFVGRRTTPRLLALYNIWQDSILKEKCLLSKMIELPSPILQPFDQDHMFFDQLDDWMPIQNSNEKSLIHKHFRSFCDTMPVDSVDGCKITDQYTNTVGSDNRNANLTTNLINLSGKYLFEITFETMTRGRTFTPSEKTVRTIVAEKPLVVYAPKDFLNNLQKLGFKTFNSLWDESYDQFDGPERYHAIMKVVRKICNLSRSKQFELYQQSRIICKHNKDTLANIINNKWTAKI